MQKGTVKWFSDAKGFGFLNAIDDKGDIFVHYHQIVMNGRKKLAKGQPVLFEAETTASSLHATKVIPLMAEEPDQNDH